MATPATSRDPMALAPARPGLLSGHMRFLSAFVERQHGVDPRDIGLVLGPTLGVTGVLSGFAAGHLIDHCFHRWRTLKVNLCLGAWRALLLFGTVGLFLRSLTWLCLACVLTEGGDDAATPNAPGPEPAVLGAVQETAGAARLGGVTWQLQETETEKDSADKKESPATNDANNMMLMVTSFLFLMIIVGCGVFFLSWRDSQGGAKKSGGSDERRKSADSEASHRGKKTLRPSKLEPPGEADHSGSKSGRMPSVVLEGRGT
eukprot:Skav205373  [mRNA]  locus=scaffold4386:94607:115516:- [translate_table: standard]